MEPVAGAAGPILECEGVRKRFGAAAAVDGVSFAIRPGEYFSLLGPSGCGKSTTLRLLAGLETPDEGEIRIAGERVNERRPWERRLGMVFQSYALFPHLTVERNVAFGLERRRLPRAEIRTRVGRMLELVRLDPGVYAARRPASLSGGERQRVALARALALEPRIEPLAAVDLQLRKAMQLELRSLNRTLGTTFVHVTHDQEEALTLSDRLAVMHRGRIAQVGPPAEIYERPRTAFVASFLGEANVLTGRIERRDGGDPELALPGGGRLRLAAEAVADGGDGGVRAVALRPERLSLHSAGQAPPGMGGLRGRVAEVEIGRAHG